jgi:hypothetical protein
MELSLINEKPQGVAQNYLVLPASKRRPWMEKIETHLREMDTGL